MTDPIINAPSARTWRDIPQPVKPRAMSRSGRRRLTLAILRTVLVVAILAGLAAGAWGVTAALQERKMPAIAKTGALETAFLTDGMLDRAWLAETLALPRHASLMEIDLAKLQARLQADNQVLAATLTRNFPTTLVVQITERTPVARVMTEWGGQQQPLLVARDGVLFAGRGHDEGMIAALPWLDGVAITRTREGFQPIEGMAVVSELLTMARLEAEHLYRSWRVVSLARLASDRQIEVKTARGHTIIFGATGDFFRQFANLDYIAEQLAAAPAAQARIDLSLGSEVPVMILPAAEPPESPAKPVRAASAPISSLLVPQTKREL